MSDDKHMTLWKQHRGTILREWWAHLTAGVADGIGIVIDGAITKSGKPVARVVPAAHALDVLGEISPAALAGLPPAVYFSDVPKVSPPARRLVVVAEGPQGLIDWVKQDDLVVTGPSGDA